MFCINKIYDKKVSNNKKYYFNRMFIKVKIVCFHLGCSKTLKQITDELKELAAKLNTTVQSRDDTRRMHVVKGALTLNHVLSSKKTSFGKV